MIVDLDICYNKLLNVTIAVVIVDVYYSCFVISDGDGYQQVYVD